jgi:BASS family bile acid:Na+ symporter
MGEGRFTTLSVFSSYLHIWLSIGIAVGYFGSPILSPYAFLAPLTLSVMMLAVGFTTLLKDFRANLGSVIPGTLVQWVMPLLGFVVGSLLQLPTEAVLSLVVLGAVSNALSANVFVKLARGRTALSSMISATSTFASLLTIPLFTFILFSQSVQIDPSLMLVNLLIYMIVPLLIGLYLGTKKALIEDRSWTGIASLALIILIVLSSSQLIIGYILITVLIATLLMNLGGYGIGFIVSRKFNFDKSTGIFVVGLRNFGIAIAILIALDFPGSTLAAPIIYGIVQSVTASILVRRI